MISQINFTGVNANWTYNHLSTIHVVAAVCYFIYGFVAIVGNVIMILAVSKLRLIQYGGFLTLLHYAITDIISGSLNVFYSPAASFYQRNFITPFLPGLVLTFGEFSRKVFIVFMAVTKCYSIVCPLRARRIMSLNWYKKTLRATWFVCVLVSVPFWATKCVYFDFVNYRWAALPETPKLTLIFGLTVNLSVTVVVLVTYPLCFYKLFKNDYRWECHHLNGDTGRARNRPVFISFKEKNLLYLFVLNAIVFIIYWIPIYIVELTRVRISYWAFWLESHRGIQIAYNPIAYYFLNNNIREAVNNLLFCRTKTVANRRTTIRSSNSSLHTTWNLREPDVALLNPKCTS